jgi:hypothetical protein
MPARLAIRLTVTSSEPACPISAIVALISDARRIGSIPTLGIVPSGLVPDKKGLRLW